MTTVAVQVPFAVPKTLFSFEEFFSLCASYITTHTQKNALEPTDIEITGLPIDICAKLIKTPQDKKLSALLHTHFGGK